MFKSSKFEDSIPQRADISRGREYSKNRGFEKLDKFGAVGHRTTQTDVNADRLELSQLLSQMIGDIVEILGRDVRVSIADVGEQIRRQGKDQSGQIQQKPGIFRR